MKRSVLAGVLALGVSAAAYGDALVLSQPVINALTPIDSIPSSNQLNSVFNGSETEALSNLTAIALSQGTVDLGVQLRAIRALTHYCRTPCGTHEAHVALETIATTPRYRDAQAGSDLLVLRAALEALGVLRIPGDVAILVPQLDHPSRDIRAAAAHALRDLGNTQAIPALRARYQLEQSDQVKIAISNALRVLGQPIQ
ncbi:MAG: HEAT repeat domain-containing protein [Deltaproteobacteria bacterium]|nr:HEAT repeat domain-containing protein [Deltaproteobacteria bacterium]